MKDNATSTVIRVVWRVFQPARSAKTALSCRLGGCQANRMNKCTLDFRSSMTNRLSRNVAFAMLVTAALVSQPLFSACDRETCCQSGANAQSVTVGQHQKPACCRNTEPTQQVPTYPCLCCADDFVGLTAETVLLHDGLVRLGGFVIPVTMSGSWAERDGFDLPRPTATGPPVFERHCCWLC